MNNSSIVTSHTLSPSSSSQLHSYSTIKRSHSAQPTSGANLNDLKEFNNTLQELNTHFKKNLKILTDIKDQIFKVCERQEARPVDDNAGIHKLERVSRLSSNRFSLLDKQISRSGYGRITFSISQNR